MAAMGWLEWIQNILSFDDMLVCVVLRGGRACGHQKQVGQNL
jgi:hypothetical protein